MDSGKIVRQILFQDIIYKAILDHGLESEQKTVDNLKREIKLISGFQQTFFFYLKFNLLENSKD